MRFLSISCAPHFAPHPLLSYPFLLLCLLLLWFLIYFKDVRSCKMNLWTQDWKFKIDYSLLLFLILVIFHSREDFSFVYKMNQPFVQFRSIGLSPLQYLCLSLPLSLGVCSSVIQTKSCSDKALIFWVTLLCPTFGFGMGVCTQNKLTHATPQAQNDDCLLREQVDSCFLMTLVWFEQGIKVSK